MAETAEKTYKGLVIQLPEKWKTAEEKEERIEEAVLFKLAETYPIDVPESLVENEVQAMVCQLYQEMRYKALRTGEINFFVERDIQDQMEDIQKEARRQVKIRCILQEITETEQIQISREELEDAQKNPQNHASLIVRLYGYSAKFITLSEEKQREFISRNIY